MTENHPPQCPMQPVGKLPPIQQKPGAQTLSQRYASEIETMRANPGRWFKFLAYEKYQAATLSNARNALRKQVPQLELATRGYTLYARWMGPQDERDEYKASVDAERELRGDEW